MDEKRKEQDELTTPLLPASALVDRGRRDLLKLLGASMALAGLAGCSTRKSAELVPYVRDPREVTPGIPNTYATSMVLDGYATGIVVESYEGRPTRVEGNPLHPASLGASGVFEQASVLGLYDPERARNARHENEPTTFDRFVEHFGEMREDEGRGLAFLLQPTSSPLLAELIERIHRRLPHASFTFSSPLQSSAPLEGAALAFGERLLPHYDLARARVIVSADADFLAMMPFHLRYARAFAARRRIASPEGEMNRLYAIEADLSSTGSMADHRLRARTSEVVFVLSAIAASVLRGLRPRPAFVSDALLDALSLHAYREQETQLEAIARDLLSHRNEAVVVVGERQPPLVHAIAYLINAGIASSDTAWFTEPVLLDHRPNGHDLTVLVDEMKRGALDTLVIVDGNPAYNAPSDLEFERALASVPTCVYLGLYEDETSRHCRWFIPAAHELESWGDARAYDGTISLIQPLIEPMNAGRTASELLAVFAGDPFPNARELLHNAWTRRRKGVDFSRFWETCLGRGLVSESALPRAPTSPTSGDVERALRALSPSPTSPKGTLELAFVADASVYDGRFANNAWLQEMPDPMTKLTWDNAARLGPATAARLGVTVEDVIEIEHEGRSIKAPVQVVPGHVEGLISLPLGYGREAGGQTCRGVGFNAYRLRTSQSPSFALGAVARKIPGITYPLAHTQRHSDQHGRPIALAATLERYQKEPDFTREHKGPLPSLLPPQNENGEQWAMSIDLSICTGCSACVIACQAENNVLVVGKDSVARGREMHWLRIDTYHSKTPGEPEIIHQPMMCQHCETAPCEYVCPVNATVHSPDGLNEMIYNRCVGTRFCSNNCPYKVRRFNWFDWIDEEPANSGRVKLQRNPEVTVRQRGVMEKCTYCVQRIRKAEIAASIERRAIRPGEVKTACEQACPTQAIRFGSLTHQDTDMVAWRREPRSYAALHDTGARPRTHYLARITNPNPEIE